MYQRAFQPKHQGLLSRVAWWHIWQHLGHGGLREHLFDIVDGEINMPCRPQKYFNSWVLELGCLILLYQHHVIRKERHQHPRRVFDSLANNESEPTVPLELFGVLWHLLLIVLAVLALLRRFVFSFFFA